MLRCKNFSGICTHERAHTLDHPEMNVIMISSSAVQDFKVVPVNKSSFRHDMFIIDMNVQTTSAGRFLAQPLAMRMKMLTKFDVKST